MCMHGGCLSAQRWSEAAGPQGSVLVPATEETSSGSSWWIQLLATWSWTLEGSIVFMYMFAANRFILISQRREEDQAVCAVLA